MLPERPLVRRVVDGDTIELADGRLLRYIGIDTPEVRRREDGRWVDDPEPMGREATAFNRRLVEGRRVRCEFDVQTLDRYGRLLAYVYLPVDETPNAAAERMANEELLRAGLAQPLTIPPNVKYTDRFLAVAREARQARRGLWADTQEHRRRGAATRGR